MTLHQNFLFHNWPEGMKGKTGRHEVKMNEIVVWEAVAFVFFFKIGICLNEAEHSMRFINLIKEIQD